MSCETFRCAVTINGTLQQKRLKGLILENVEATFSFLIFSRFPLMSKM